MSVQACTSVEITCGTTETGLTVFSFTTTPPVDGSIQLPLTQMEAYSSHTASLLQYNTALLTLHVLLLKVQLLLNRA